jgi:acyl-CoA dehydrogenase
MPAKEISMAKLYASERICEIALSGMRLLGGRAYLADTPMPRRLREAMLAYYAGGTVEIQRNLIARAIGLR